MWSVRVSNPPGLCSSIRLPSPVPSWAPSATVCGPESCCFKTQQVWPWLFPLLPPESRIIMTQLRWSEWAQVHELLGSQIWKAPSEAPSTRWSALICDECWPNLFILLNSWWPHSSNQAVTLKPLSYPLCSPQMSREVGERESTLVLVSKGLVKLFSSEMERPWEVCMYRNTYSRNLIKCVEIRSCKKKKKKAFSFSHWQVSSWETWMFFIPWKKTLWKELSIICAHFSSSLSKTFRPRNVLFILLF